MEPGADTPEGIERALARLVPASLSGDGMAAIEETIDELAGTPVAESAATGGESRRDSRQDSRRGVVRWAAAAAVVGGLAALGMGWAVTADRGEPGRAVIEPAEVVLLESSERVVEAAAETELLTDDDGSVNRAWHLNVVKEETYRDVETGYEVRVVHPRDELVMMPVSHF